MGAREAARYIVIGKSIMKIFCTSLICFIILWSTAMAQENETPTLSITEQLTFSTVRIEVTTKEGSGTGTGFFFNFLDDGKI